MLRGKNILYGLIIAALTMLITYIICGVIMKDYYVWGGVQLALSIFYLLFARLIKGRKIKRVRQEIPQRDERLRSTIDFSHPEIKKIETFYYSLFWAAIFGIVFNVIGSKLFGMGILPSDFNPEP